jgi:hypothetical protein
MDPISTIVHLTATGPAAGTPFCGINKAAAQQTGATFMHVPYSHLDRFFARTDLCPDCRKVWDDAADEKETE